MCVVHLQQRRASAARPLPEASRPQSTAGPHGRRRPRAARLRRLRLVASQGPAALPPGPGARGGLAGRPLSSSRLAPGPCRRAPRGLVYSAHPLPQEPRWRRCSACPEGSEAGAATKALSENTSGLAIFVFLPVMDDGLLEAWGRKPRAASRVVV